MMRWIRNTRSGPGFTLLLLLLGVTALGVGPAWAQGAASGRAFEAVYLSSALGSGPYEMAQLISKFVGEKNPRLRVATPETPGYVYNLKLMVKSPEKWRNYIFGATTGSAWMGQVGLQPLYDTRYVLPDSKILVGNTLWSMFFVTLDPNIKSLADLKGKRIGLGLRGQSHYGGLGILWLEVSGVTPKNSTIDFLGPVQATEALIDGRVDAAVTGAAFEPSLRYKAPLPPLNQVAASGRSFYYLMPDPAAIEKLNKERDAPFVIHKFPAGSLPKQTKDMMATADIDVMMVHASFPEDSAYEFTKSLIKLAPDIGKYHALGKMWTREMLSFGLTEANTHPGSIRAFKEAGLWKAK